MSIYIFLKMEEYTYEMKNKYNREPVFIKTRP